MREFVQIYRYEDESISYWVTELDDTDADAIGAILERYSSTGFSCRGGMTVVLEDLKKTFFEMPERGK